MTRSGQFYQPPNDYLFSINFGFSHLTEFTIMIYQGFVHFILFIQNLKISRITHFLNIILIKNIVRQRGKF